MSQKSRTTKKWTRDEILTAASMWNDLCTGEEIASFFGVTKDKIFQLVYRHRRHFDLRDGVNTKNTAKLNLDVVLSYFDKGLSTKEIAAELGVKPDSVSQFLRRNGIRREKPKREVKEVIKKEYPKDAAPPFFRLKDLVIPTPENTEIQYEFVEHPMPSNALMTPFYCLEVGQCSWVSGGFWDKVSYDTPCCGLPVVDRRGKGLVKSYCDFHHRVSIREE